MEEERRNAGEVVNEYLQAATRRDVDAMAELLDDELVFETPREPLDKEMYLEFVAALFAAFPDWRIDHREPRHAGRRPVVVVTVRMSGTHTGRLELPIPGFAVVPPTGRTVILPSQNYTYTVADGRIVRIKDHPVPHGGIVGVLEQIGVSKWRIVRYVIALDRALRRRSGSR